MSRKVALLGILLVVTTAGFGQLAQHWEKAIRFDGLDPAIQDSLFQRKANCLLRDRRGMTWIGTEQGLVHYNGHEIVAVKDTLSNGVSLSQVAVQTLMETSGGDIWIGTKSEGALRFRPHQNTFQQYPMIFSGQTKRQIPSVLSFYEGKEQILWAGTFGGGVYYYDSLEDRFTPFQDPTDSSNLLATTVVMDLHEDKHGILWGATFGSGLIRIDPHYQTIKQYSFTNKARALPTNDLFCLEEGEEGTLWIGTYGYGLVQYDRRTETFSVPLPDLTNSYVQSLHYHRGYLWVGTQDHGLLCYDTRSGAIYPFTYTSGDTYSIADNNVSQVVIDNYGTLWVVTANGINLAYAESTSFSILESDPNSPIHQPITSLASSQSGDIWMGTADASLYQWVEREGRMIRHNIGFTDEFLMSYTGNIITTIKEDQQKGVWVGTSDGTIARWNHQEQEWKIYQLPSLNNHQTSEAIEAIYQDRKGTVWIGVLEQGLFYWDTEKDSIQPAHDRWPSLGSSFTPKVFLEDQQYLWIGTLSKGIIQWHRTTGQIVRYSKQAVSDQSTLPSNQITGLALDAHGYLWIGTFDQGLCKLNTRTGTFQQVREQEGLLSNRVTSISGGRDQKIWIGSVQGISSYDWRNGQIRNYPSEEFLLGKELVHYSSSSQGDLQYFGTLTGVVRVEADPDSTSYYDPPLLATSFVSNNQLISFNPTAPTNQINLRYDDNAIEVSYALQQFVFPKKHRYEYRLLGLEQQWKSVGPRTLASYTNLPPGTYQLQVRAHSSQNMSVIMKDPVVVVVHPAWYQTFAFRILMIAVSLGLIGGLYYYRIASVQKQNRTLETLVAERTRELTTKNKYIEQQHHDIQLQNQKLEEAQTIIQQKNKDLQCMNEVLEERVQLRTQELATTNEELVKTNDELDLFVYRAYHDIIGPVARIEGLCQVAAMEVKGQDMVNQYLDKLLDNCQTARTTLQKVLQIHHVRHHVLQISSVKMRDFIQQLYADVCASFPDLKDEPMFNFSCDTSLSLKTDLELLKLVLQSFLKNAIQYRRDVADAWVKVTVQRPDSSTVRVSVEDNGVGILPSVRNKVFSMFFRGHESKSGTGLGLYIAQLAAERLEGTVAYVDAGEYTQFSVDLPITLEKPVAGKMTAKPEPLQVRSL